MLKEERQDSLKTIVPNGSLVDDADDDNYQRMNEGGTNGVKDGKL